jgi:hypothetical protein
LRIPPQLTASSNSPSGFFSSSFDSFAFFFPDLQAKEERGVKNIWFSKRRKSYKVEDGDDNMAIAHQHLKISSTKLQSSRALSSMSASIVNAIPPKNMSRGDPPSPPPNPPPSPSRTISLHEERA